MRGKRKQTRRVFVWLIVLHVACAGGSAWAAQGRHWVGAWSAAMMRAPVPASALLNEQQNVAPLSGQTVRQMVNVGVDGQRIRIRLSNAFGEQPLVLSASSVGLRTAAGGSDVAASSLHALRFGGTGTVTIPPGSYRDSDPVALPVRAGDTLGISLYGAGRIAPSTWHQDALRTNFVSIKGNYTASAAMAVARTIGDNYWLSGVDVETSQRTAVIVALGDSITNGFQSSIDRDARYPDVLARRLRQADTDTCRHAVLNAGIDGNQVRAFGGTYGLGQSMLDRLDRDVLSRQGARFLLLLGGINDIGVPTMVARKSGRTIDAAATAAHVIDGLGRIIASAHAAGLRVYGATLTPFEGTRDAYSVEGEQAREKINDWIRHRGRYDAVIDFDLATRDPSHRQRLQPGLDSGDHIHPNDRGYQAMAAAIPLRLLACH
ncbi:SGNH/GDSL hydrolase family protein [Rhodanobacter sp. Col0626]|uniref:SGNH/GDSL hydrolase family protein n=1 Tax=Rhodanobacter sp. Col0626 TaxID=3415679 RepID=UPI003CEC29D7